MKTFGSILIAAAVATSAGAGQSDRDYDNRLDTATTIEQRLNSNGDATTDSTKMVLSSKSAVTNENPYGVDASDSR